VTAEAVFAAATAGDALAVRILGDVVEHVAMAVIALAAIAGPEVIVLDGSIGRALAPWLDTMGRLAARHLLGPPLLVASSLGTYATALGAVAAALQLAQRRGAPGPYRGTLTVDTAPDVVARSDVA